MTAVVEEVLPLCDQCASLKADFYTVASLFRFIESAAFTCESLPLDFKFRFGDLKDFDVERLSQAVLNNTSLRIVHDSLTYDGRFIDACLRNPRITTIYFPFFKSIGGPLLPIRTVTHVLEALDPDGGRCVAINHPEFEELHLLSILTSHPGLLMNGWWNVITVTDKISADALVAVLRNPKFALRAISLRFTREGKEHVRAIEAAMRSCTSVTHLSVSGVKRSDDPSPTVLDSFLRSCQFLKHFATSRSLSMLHLEENRVVEDFQVPSDLDNTGEFCIYLGKRNVCASLGTCRFLWLWWGEPLEFYGFRHYGGMGCVSDGKNELGRA